MYKTDSECVQAFGLRTHFGGGRSTGFALIYDSTESMKKFEPHYRLVRVGQAEPIQKVARQQRKQRKNRGKKVFGTGKRLAKRKSKQQD